MPAIELVAVERAGGSDDREAIAWSERARLQHHVVQKPRHLVGDRAVVVAAEPLAQRSRLRPDARRPARRGTAPSPAAAASSASSTA